MADDQFCKKIILLNKEKIYLFTNAKLDKFLEKIVVFTILSLLSYNQVVSYIIDTASYNNYHFFIFKIPDISFLIKYITNDSIFNKKSYCIGIQNNIIMFLFPNLFDIKVIYFSNSIALRKYINFVHSNWYSYN